MPAAPHEDITLPEVTGGFARRWLWRLARPAIRELFVLRRLSKLHRAGRELRPDEPFAGILEAGKVDLHVDQDGLERIPRKDALVVVANHPFPGWDAVSVIAALRRVRPDVRIIANRHVARIPLLREFGILVEIIATNISTADAAANARAMRDALRWLHDGHVLLVFPSGEVAHRTWKRREIIDSPWHPTVGRLISASRSPALPIRVRGRSPRFIQWAGLVHPMLRTLLLPRAVAARAGQPVELVVGSPLPWERLRDAGSPEAIVATLREACDALANGGPADHQPTIPSPQHAPEELAAEVARLPESDRLVERGEFEVWCTTAERIPLLLLEIGRLREIAFRAVGEGTGKTIDIDRFDHTYRHLFLWHPRRSEVIGAYRLGLTDEILPKQGIDGLYTSTLFHYAPKLVEAAGPTIELGRSFIRPEWQRHPTALLLLWKGIGAFIVKNPRYRRLFGPVSISDRYTSMSKELLMAFLEATARDSQLAALVTARKPPERHPSPALESVPTSIEAVERLLAKCESEGLSVPVLLRQYLQLDAKLLAFNVDDSFGHAIDALMYMDLNGLDDRVVRFYLGKEGYQRFMQAKAEQGSEGSGVRGQGSG